MTNEEKIFKYLDFYIDKLRSKSDQLGIDSSDASRRHSNIFLLGSLKECMQFQLQTDLERQTFRRGWIGSLKKRGRPTDIPLATIDLYDRLIEIIESVKELDIPTESFVAMCQAELDMIDYSHIDFGKMHIDQEVALGEISQLMDVITNDAKQSSEIMAQLEELKSSFNSIFSNQA